MIIDYKYCDNNNGTRTYKLKNSTRRTVNILKELC